MLRHSTCFTVGWRFLLSGEMTNYRTLVVAPKTDLLLVDDEVQQVVNLLGAKVLQGSQATIHGLLAILREPFDIIWFATHGDEAGVLLADGKLATSEITTMIRSAGAQLTVLNTCSSLPVALTIHHELKTAFVCTVKKVPDRTAFITGTVFAQKLASGLSFHESYLAAKPGQNTTYTFLGDEGRKMTPPKNSNNPPTASGPAARFEEIVEQLDVIVNGSVRYNVPGLAKSMGEFAEGMKSIERRVEKLEEEQKSLAQVIRKGEEEQRFVRRLLVVVIVILALILVILCIAVFFRSGGVG